MQEALFVSCHLCKVFQINQFAYIGCKSGSLLWNRAIESETHSMIHALAHTQRHWNYLFFCPAGKPTYSSPWQPQEWKKMPMMSKREMVCQKSAVSLYRVQLRIQCYFVSHGQVNLAKHVAGISIHAWLQHIWACINDYTYMGLYKPHTGQINNADPRSQVNMKRKMQPILLVQYDVFLRDTEY